MTESKEAVRVGSKWREAKPSHVSKDRRLDVIRVMGVVEGYVVARRTGCIPFLIHTRDWPKIFRPLTGERG